MRNDLEALKRIFVPLDEKPQPVDGLVIVTESSTVSEEGVRNGAQTEFRQMGVLPIITSYAEALPPAKKATLDFGYDEHSRLSPVAVLGWAPMQASGDTDASSKILRLIPGDEEFVVEYPAESGGVGGASPIRWVSLNIPNLDLGTPEFIGVLDLAMGNSHVRIEAGQRFVQGKFVGTPPSRRG